MSIRFLGWLFGIVTLMTLSSNISFVFSQAQEEGLLNIEISMGEVPGSTSYLDDIRPLFHRVSF